MNASYQALRKWCGGFLLINVVIILMCSCNKQDKQEVPESIPSSVDISSEDGKHLGTLKESKDGKELYWYVDGQEAELVGSYFDEIKQKLSVSDTNVIAAVYVRDCGATTGLATRLGLFKTDERTGAAENDTVLVLQGQPPVELELGEDGRLLVSIPEIEELQVYQRKEQSYGIKIEYRESLGEWPKLREVYVKDDLLKNNKNYGYAGSRKEFSQETLMRIAGWHQMKSGLWKSSFGYWSGDSPYGDDFGGCNMIKLGIILYQSDNKKPVNR
jgi:hypothetical protein